MRWENKLHNCVVISPHYDCIRSANINAGYLYNIHNGLLMHEQYYLPAHLLMRGVLKTATPASSTPRLDQCEFEVVIGRFRAALEAYIGTHAFQNFTSGAGRRRAASAAAARRQHTRGGKE